MPPGRNRTSACAARLAGFGFPSAEEPSRVLPAAGPAGPTLPLPGRVHHVRANPARSRPSGLTLPHVPSTPVRRISHPRRPRSLRSPSWRCTPVQAPVLCLPGQAGLPVPGALQEAPPIVSGEPEHGAGAVVLASRAPTMPSWNSTSTHPTSLLPSALKNCARSGPTVRGLWRLPNTPEVSPPAHG